MLLGGSRSWVQGSGLADIGFRIYVIVAATLRESQSDLRIFLGGHALEL